jgi:hypothetical protein
MKITNYCWSTRWHNQAAEPCWCLTGAAGGNTRYCSGCCQFARVSTPLRPISSFVRRLMASVGEAEEVAVTQGLEFALLGPVRAWRDGTELALGSPQQRATLARISAQPSAFPLADG